jgi:amidase
MKDSLKMKKDHPMLSRGFCWILILFWIALSCNRHPHTTQTSCQDTFQFMEADIAQIQQGYRNKSFTIKALVQAYLDRIDAIDKHGPGLHAVIQVNPDVIKIAEQLDVEMKEGKLRGPLHGIPVLLKDNIDTHDRMFTTAGSRALMKSMPIKDSFIAKQLRDAGAIIIGKANLSEWANFRGQLSTSGWSGLGGQTKNPYVLTRNPCGSSSGSAVAVSANLTMLAIGTETDGSIVCPSHMNGIVGIKPTVGLVSRSGVIPISYTQDTPGPMARTVRDAAICLGVLAGVDTCDKKTLQGTRKSYNDYTQFLKTDGVKGKRIGFYKGYSGINYKVDTIMFQAIQFLKSKGATVIEIEKIPTEQTDQCSFEVMLYEYKDGLNNYFKSLGTHSHIKNIDDLIKFNKSDSVELKYFNQKYLEMTQKKGDLSSVEYVKALTQMLKGTRDQGINKMMNEQKLDAIVVPTGSPAWETDLVNGDGYQFGSSSLAAQAGYPSITVPMGFVDNLPVGISFFGRAWSEPVLLEIAYAYEMGTKHRTPPKFITSD